MKMSRLFFHSLKEVPQDAEVPSHILMIRAGMIMRLASGMYHYLPLGFKALKNIENIVREEMDKAGGQELLMPALNPAEIWKESGRWDEMGDNMFRLKDRNQHEFCLGMTHEEIITEIVRKRVKSYRELPLMLYQIQTKFRDEPRPRGGLIRGREFVMKDMYSFHISWKDLRHTYDKMYKAYSNAFTRCGLNFKVVEADSGAMGGDCCHEFMLASPFGEDTMFYCPACDYAANLELAYFSQPGSEDLSDYGPEIEQIATPGVSTIEQLSNFLKLPPQSFIKTLIYKTEGRFLAVLIRGDRELNEVKLRKALKVKILEMADAGEIEQATGGPLGFSGPIGLKGVTVIADSEVVGMKNAVAGANLKDYHFRNVAFGRDFKPDMIEQVRNAVEGDLCPKCKEKMAMDRSVEIGHIFQLGTKYSQAMGATFQDENGEEKPVIMGCYGIGVSRMVAAVIEGNNDKDGIIWPVSVAPYKVMVMPVMANSPEQMAVAEQLYRELQAEGIEVLLEDRDLRPGVKFKDADLMGIPVRLVIGDKTLPNGELEFKIRKTGEVRLVKITEAKELVKEFIRKELEELNKNCQI